MENAKAKMVARRVKKGFNPIESEVLLDELLESHYGDNLAHALVFEEFATEAQAYKFINS